MLEGRVPVIPIYPPFSSTPGWCLLAVRNFPGTHLLLGCPSSLFQSSTMWEHRSRANANSLQEAQRRDISASIMGKSPPFSWSSETQLALEGVIMPPISHPSPARWKQEGGNSCLCWLCLHPTNHNNEFSLLFHCPGWGAPKFYLGKSRRKDPEMISLLFSLRTLP